MALTEAVWFTETPPLRAKAAWERWNPAMGTMAQAAAVAQAQGFDVVEAFQVPSEAWWEYYRPLEQQCLARKDDHSLPRLTAATGRSLEQGAPIVPCFSASIDYGRRDGIISYGWYLRRTRTTGRT